MEFVKKIALYGDSILKGVQLSDNERYTVDNRMGLEDLAKEYSIELANMSKFGCTVTKGEAMLDKGLQKGMTCQAVVMDFGGNDCDFDWRAVSEAPDCEHLPNTPISLFCETYKRMVSKLRSANIIPVLTNLPPISAQRYFDWFCRAGLSKENILRWLGSVETINRYQEGYSLAVERIARECSVPLIDIRSEFLLRRHADELLCADGIHPNTAGQKVIAAAFSSFARENLAGRVPA